MYYKAEQTFYILASFVIFTAAFILVPSAHPETIALQQEIKSQFSRAWIQTIGDQPYFTEVAEVYDGIQNFYAQAADSSIALIRHEEADRDLAFIFHGIYNEFKNVAIAHLPSPRSVVTQTPPIMDTVISEVPRITAPVGLVSGEEIKTPPIANMHKAWVTIQDNMTGQLYCLAIYNGEVNKYIGECVDEYY